MKQRRTRESGAPPVATMDARAFTLLSLTVLCAIVAHAAHLPVWYIAPLAAIIVARWWRRRRRRGRVSGWSRAAMLLATALAVFAKYQTPFGPDPGAAIVCGLLVLKLLESETVRDARMAVGFSCFTLMTVLLFDQALVMTLVVGLMLLPALATLRALEPGLPESGWLAAFRPGSALLLASLPLTLLGFLLIPRLATPLWGSPNQGMARSGISDRMAPGDLHSLLNDNSVAMRVGFDGEPPAADQRYFRGMVLWRFDGREWTPGFAARRPGPDAPLAQRGDLVRYQVTLLPSHQHWLFALDVPIAAPRDAQLGPDRTLLASKPVDQTLRYNVTSAVDYRLHPDRLPPGLRRWALELPAGYDPRARALAKDWRAKAGNDDAAVIRDALTLFHTGGFVYALDVPPLGRNSIDDFLFNTRTGFCEHYASAFTFLMRAAGIPARVVVGYQGGYWNNVAHYLLVRQSNAHAWTEVWLQGRGWVRIDPTAVVSTIEMADAGGDNGAPIGGSIGGWWLPWQNRMDIINRWWSQSIINFDALSQSHLFRPFGVNRTDAQTLGIALAIVMFLGLGIGALLASLKPREKPRDALAAAQLRLQKRLARAGVVRGHAEGPGDYYERSARAMPSAAPMLRALSTEYLLLRYAHSEPPPERVRDFVRQVRRLRPSRVL
jgi:transglutaminase-like putative cysteine protease